MAVTLVPPSADLRSLVRHFRIQEVHLTGEALHWPLTARSDQFLEFYLGDPYRVVDISGGPVRMVAPAVVVGPHTERSEDLVLQGSLRVFTILFQPSGFHYLFGLPMQELANQAWSAEDVAGKEVLHLRARLQAARNDSERVAFAESFLRARYRAPLRVDPVQRAADMILTTRGKTSVDSLPRAVGLGVRQLERRFLVQIGLSPKMLCRLARLQHALHLREDLPEVGWARIAVQAGFYDQMHLVKEFHSLAGESPSAFMESLRAAKLRLRGKV